MKYKTVIEIMTEANNKNEASDIVGEYLSGDISSGVDMKCRTKPVLLYRRALAASVTALSILLVFGTIFAAGIKTGKQAMPALSGVSAVQPPLKTAPIDKKNVDFKEEWQKKHDQKALQSLSK